VRLQLWYITARVTKYVTEMRYVMVNKDLNLM